MEGVGKDIETFLEQTSHKRQGTTSSLTAEPFDELCESDAIQSGTESPEPVANRRSLESEKETPNSERVRTSYDLAKFKTKPDIDEEISTDNSPAETKELILSRVENSCNFDVSTTIASNRYEQLLELFVFALGSFIITHCVLNFDSIVCSIEDELRNIGRDDIVQFVKLVLRYIAIFYAGIFGGLKKSNARATCALGNPLYQPDSTDHCQMCMDIQGVAIHSPMEEPSLIPSKLTHTGRPIVFRKWSVKVNLCDIHYQVLDHMRLHENFYSDFKSNVGNLTKIQDLAWEQSISRIEADLRAHLIWSPDRYMTSKVITNMFPRPSFLDGRNFTELKNLFIDGPDSPPFELPSSEYYGNCYIQASGSRTVVLTIEGCPLCRKLTVTLHPKDILFYIGSVWTVSSQPLGNSTSIAALLRFY